ncbi:MAG: hypothetical protein LUQ71_08090, partial [Methanoregula sp.]|nr:hypothetical protein [Methanoregula sp.]
MSTDLLFEHFTTLATAPDGIARLRELILQLAVQGKLGTQDAGDEPIKIRKSKGHASDSGSAPQNPFNIPKNWVWITIPTLVGSEGLFVDGDWIESKDQDPEGSIRLIQLSDIGEGNFRDHSNRYLTKERAIQLKCTFLEKGDILISRLGEPLGKSCI